LPGQGSEVRGQKRAGQRVRLEIARAIRAFRVKANSLFTIARERSLEMRRITHEFMDAATKTRVGRITSGSRRNWSVPGGLDRSRDHHGKRLNRVIYRLANTARRYDGDVSLRRLVLLALALCSSAGAQVLSGKGAELPLNVVVTPHFSVIHPPRLETYARRVAAAAEGIHDRVIGTVGNDPGRTFIVVNDETDSFNGYAVPGPYPFVRVYATFPRPNDIGTQWEDAIRVLVGHEFTHVAHLSTHDASRDALRNVFGPIPGVTDARTAPTWFTEGYAVYLETQLTRGGRSQDATIRTIRAQTARGGTWPSLSDASIAPLERWPYGTTRYAFGAGFVPFLIEKYGEAGIRRAIATYNLGGFDFSDAWDAALGSRLEPLWDEWTAQEQGRAKSESNAMTATGLSAGKAFVGGSGPVWRNDDLLAYRNGTEVRIVSRSNQPVPFEARALPSRPDRLSWATDGSLVYSRLTDEGASTFGEVYRLQLDGTETRLTDQARARDAVADGDCVLYVRDVVDGSSLKRICPNAETTVYTAPDGWHIMQPAPRGKTTALTVWRPGGFLDVAVLEGQRLRFITSDAAQDQFPGWTTDGQLVFSSDRSGIFQAYRANPNQTGEIGSSLRLNQLSAAPGGVYAPSVSPAGRLAFGSYTAVGTEVRISEPTTGTALEAQRLEPDAYQAPAGLEYPVESYAPNLSPLFWTPITPSGLGATLYGADAAGIHNWTISAGIAPTFDPVSGLGVRPDLNTTYSFNPWLDWRFNASATWDGYGPRAGLSATTAGSTEFGILGSLDYQITPFARLDVKGAVAGLNLSAKNLSTDPFGYATRGWAFGGFVTTRLGFGAQFTLAGTVLDVPLEGILRAYPDGATGYGTGDLRVSSQFSLRPSWRIGDGIHGLERLTIRPFLEVSRIGLGGAFGGGVQVLADAYVVYYAPVTLGLELGFNTYGGFNLSLVSFIPLLNGLRSDPSTTNPFSTPSRRNP
jgi:hypothetical protein